MAVKVFVLVLVAFAGALIAFPQDDKLAQAQAAYRAGEYQRAYDLAKAAVDADPKSVDAHMLMGNAASGLKKHDDAVTAFTTVIALQPKLFVAWDRRGDAQLKLGKFKNAVEDFDAALKLRPDFAPEHWRRGIALYYSGRYEDGAKQFEVHKKANPQDVENAAWHYLCQMKVISKAEAVNQLIDVTADRRVPMAEIQKLYAGKLKPEEVLAAAEKLKADTEAGQEARFYAHLYIGLWHASEGNAELAKEHINTAEKKHPISHYMWDIAKVHPKP